MILVVEDSLEDQFLIQSAFDAIDPLLPVRFFVSSEDFVAFAQQNLMQDDICQNKLVLSDINMPGLGGFYGLVEVKKLNIDRLFFVMLSTSSNANDIFKAYELGVDGFITKPASYAQLEILLLKILNFWWYAG